MTEKPTSSTEEEAAKTHLGDLPSVIPIFPLAGTILLPGSNLPLNIFEPRYLKMVKDARASHALIGMVQPQNADDQSHAPAIYDIGGAGRISHYAETKDGRNIIRLTGVCRFRIKSELEVLTPYRQAQPDWPAFSGDLAPDSNINPIERTQLMDALKVYLDQKGLQADYDGINTAPDSVLINTLSMIIPFAVPEKQALLESADTHTRAETLQSLLVMLTRATQQDPSHRPS